MRYLGDLGVKLDDVVVLAILTELSAPTMGELTRDGFVSGWKKLQYVSLSSPASCIWTEYTLLVRKADWPSPFAQWRHYTQTTVPYRRFPPKTDLNPWLLQESIQIYFQARPHSWPKIPFPRHRNRVLAPSPQPTLISMVIPPNPLARLVDYLPGGTMAQGREQGHVGADGRFHDQVFGRPDDELVERGRSLARRVRWFCHIYQREEGRRQHGYWVKYPGSGEENKDSFKSCGIPEFLSLNHVFCDIPIPNTNDGRITSAMRGKVVGIGTKARFYLRYSLSSVGGVFSNFFSPHNYVLEHKEMSELII